MNDDEAQSFAAEWVAAWNRRDLDAILAKYRDDARFVSPKAAQLVGGAVVEGKAELRRYWEIALARIASLRFTLEHVVRDAAGERIVVFYTAEIDGVRMRAAETFILAADGRVAGGEALYGAVLR